MAISLELRFEIEDLFQRYAAILDDGELDEWLDLFARECTYEVIPRENYDRKLPLAVVRCESRGMLEDRVYAIRKTLMYEPRYVRHLINGVRVTGEEDDGWCVEANYAVFETPANELSRVFNVGRYIDRVVREDAALKFAGKRCVYDSLLVPTSIVFPL